MNMDFITQPLIVLFIFGAIYLVFELFVRRKERMMIIEKMTEIKSEDLGKSRASLLTNYGLLSFHFKGLRIGMLLLGIGLGILVAFFILDIFTSGAYIQGHFENYEVASSIYAACVCLFGGFALVGSYLIEQKMKDNHPSED